MAVKSEAFESFYVNEYAAGDEQAAARIKSNFDGEVYTSHFAELYSVWELQDARNAQLRAEVERLKAGLRFYASHRHMRGFPDDWASDWDTCSGEPGNWWFNSEEVTEQSVGVEDGSIAAAILNGAVMTPDSDETYCEMPSKENI